MLQHHPRLYGALCSPVAECAQVQMTGGRAVNLVDGLPRGSV